MVVRLLGSIMIFGLSLPFVGMSAFAHELQPQIGAQIRKVQGCADGISDAQYPCPRILTDDQVLSARGAESLEDCKQKLEHNVESLWSIAGWPVKSLALPRLSLVVLDNASGSPIRDERVQYDTPHVVPGPGGEDLVEIRAVYDSRRACRVLGADGLWNVLKDLKTSNASLPKIESAKWSDTAVKAVSADDGERVPSGDELLRSLPALF